MWKMYMNRRPFLLFLHKLIYKNEKASKPSGVFGFWSLHRSWKQDGYRKQQRSQVFHLLVVLYFWVSNYRLFSIVLLDRYMEAFSEKQKRGLGLLALL